MCLARPVYPEFGVNRLKILEPLQNPSLVTPLAEYRCGFAISRPATVYACREFEVGAHLSCYLVSGTGPWYVDLANAPTLWWLDNRFVKAVRTDGLGWASVKLHVVEPGLHVVTVEFPGMFKDGDYYRPARAEHKLLVEPPPAQPTPPTIPSQLPLTLLLTYVGAAIPLVFVGSVMVAQIATEARPGKPI
jgi:hypothetical protein